MASAISSARYRGGLKKYYGAVNGALIGAAFVLVFILATMALTGDTTFLWTEWKSIGLWSLLTAINGAPIGFFSNNRSDRRRS
jgi:hypothetical protein